MLRVWIIFILLHQGYSLISVTAGQLGEPVTFKCLTPLKYSITRIKWYKQSTGESLALIATFLKSTVTPIFNEDFSTSRFAATCSPVMSTLTILKTVPEDEALYHCVAFTWETDVWTGTYLSLKGNNEETMKYTVVQWPVLSDPVQPGDSVTLQCSLLLDSLMGSCPDTDSVHWFGVRSNKSVGNIVYSKGFRPYECHRKLNTPAPTKSCVYHLSKKITSSDAGTYYCALAACGEILFGSGTKLDIEGSSEWFHGGSKMNIISLLCAVIGASVLATAILIIISEKKKCDSCNDTVSLERNFGRRNIKREVDTRIYSSAIFTVIKSDGGGRRSVEREKAYVALKEQRETA